MPSKYVSKRYVKKAKTMPKKRSKKTSKTVINTTKVVTIPREAYVKLNYKDIFLNPSIAAGAQLISVYNCMTVVPKADPSIGPVAGDKIVCGIPEWSTFYDQYTPLDVSIKLTVTNFNTANNFLSIVVLPRLVKDSLATDKIALDAMNYEQLSSMPNAKTTIIASGNNQRGQRSIYMKRSTKYMLDIKDIKDNSDINFQMPQGTNTANCTLGLDYDNCWYYYVRYFNRGGAVIPQTTFEIRVDMMYTYFLRNRQFIEQLTSTEP